MHMNDSDFCVCCGRYVMEGSMVCEKCRDDESYD